MIRAFFLMTLAMLAFSTGSQAGPHPDSAGVEKTIRANISRLSPNFRIDAIRPLADIPGLYEIQSGKNVFYSDATGDHLISGHIFNTRDRKDLTSARLEDINRIDWNILPLKDAIVSGDPRGAPIAIFTDPDCPYCRRLEHELPKIRGVKVYTFLFPITQLHPKARAKAEAIWCSNNRHKTLQDIMLKGVPLTQIKSSVCKTPIDHNLELAASLGITGTPTLIAHDGRKRAGGMSAEQLMQWAKR
ncbi:MAG: DsbC family protein [Mariprofundaceae bacterium]|nr:DsbC family protein [Mariprofundaceae bacterium]